MQQNLATCEASGGSSGDSGHASEPENCPAGKQHDTVLPTKRRFSNPHTTVVMKQSCTTSRKLNASSQVPQNMESKSSFNKSYRLGSPPKTASRIRHLSSSSTDGNDHFSGINRNSNSRQRRVSAACSRVRPRISVRVPEFTGTSKRNAANLSSRRKSIDCPYQIWRLADHDSAAIYPENSPSRIDIAYGIRDVQDEHTVFPPLTGECIREKTVVLNQGNNLSVQSRSRNRSGQEKSYIQSLTSEERGSVKRSISPAPPDRKISTGCHQRSASIDYTSDLKPTTGRKSPSPYKSTYRKSDPTCRSFNVDQSHLKVASRPSSAAKDNNQKSFPRKMYKVIPSSFEDTNPDFSIPLQNGDMSEYSTNKLFAKPSGSSHFRSTSVYSPSSGGSVEPVSSKTKTLRSQKRRASLPTTSLFVRGPESNRSPEFYKAFAELRVRDVSTPIDKRDISDQRTPSARSASTGNSFKDQNIAGSGSVNRSRDLLQRIEEIPTDASYASPASGPVKDSSIQPQTVDNKPAVCYIANPELETSGEKSRDDSAFVDGNEDDTSAELLPEMNQRRSPNADLLNSTTGVKQVIGPKSKSLFHIPGPGLVASKVKSRLQHTKEISKNEENRHFVVGGTATVTPIPSDQLVVGYDDAVGRVIDVSILDEADEDICDDDFQQKRIIRWLMDVKTGTDAEQRIRERTPPPSPEPNQQTAIVVVYNGDQKAR